MAARSEGQMIIVGTILAGMLAATGFVLLIIAVTRGRKRNPPNHE